MRTSERSVEGGRCVLVDDAFEEQTVREWHDELMKRRDLRFSPRSDAVESSTSLLFANFVKATDEGWEGRLPAVCGRMREILEGLLGASLRFDRSQINYTLHGEQRLVHRDRGTDWTTLYYANPEWDKDWMGETLIYSQDESEVLAAVTPRPGRILAFTSDLPHRVGVPSRVCTKTRVGVVSRYLLA